MIDHKRVLSIKIVEVWERNNKLCSSQPVETANKSLELTACSVGERRSFSRLYTVHTRTAIVGGSSTQALAGLF